MAQRTFVQMIDDTDGTIGTDAEIVTVDFRWGGVDYEVDLTLKNADELRARLAGYIAAGRRVQRAGGAPARANPRDRRTEKEEKAAKTAEYALIRMWARKNGFTVGDKRIKQDVIDAYYRAQAEQIQQRHVTEAPPETQPSTNAAPAIPIPTFSAAPQPKVGANAQ